MNEKKTNEYKLSTYLNAINYSKDLLLDSDAQEDSLINIKKLKGLDIQTHFIQLQDKDPSDLGFENILPLLKKENKPMSFQDEMKMRLGL